MTEPRQTTGPSGTDAGPPPLDFDPWAAPASPPPRAVPDLSALFAIFDALRGLVPAELQQQVTALQRELLLTIRALIDWYLERLDGHPRPSQVEEIPID